jgi:hypothetical protein
LTLTRRHLMANHQNENSGSGTAVAYHAKHTAGSAVDMVKDAATSVGKKAGEAASYLGQKADDASMAVGKGMKSLGGTIREEGPQEGLLGSAGSTVAATLESSGKYLQEHGLSGIADDIAQTIRRHPLPAVLIGIGVGYMLARVLRS